MGVVRVRNPLAASGGTDPEPLAEVRLLAAKWQVGSVHRNGPDLVFGYRNAKRMGQLVERSGGRLKAIDEIKVIEAREH